MTDTPATKPETPTESGLPKTFDPATIEARWAAHWESAGLFRPHRPDAAPYTIVMPPPNVTGALHIGHALDITLQDVLIRYERLRGRDALWVVGTDHAGIATQMVVERQMNERGEKRSDFSRDDFIAKVWEWKATSGGTITSQLRRLGASCDWANERFTMDEGFSKAVTKVFVQLYNEGLLYRDKRLVNWDPGLKTAISDLEVETREVAGKFWHFKYPLADGARTADGKDHIIVATTRPETMLADMAVAVNAKDERYASLVAARAKVVLPITGRIIPIITDDHADPELGSGAVKITPGHDFNDFEVGRRAGIEARDMLNMFNAEANVVQTADGLIPEKYLSLHRFRRDGIDGARELVVQELKATGRLVIHTDKDGNEKEAEDRVIQTPFGDRSGVVIEPWLTDQWYVDAKTLAQPAIEAVRSGAINIVPKTWEKTFFNWMDNIQPWCVSRQLWWGHRIPAWYGPKKRDDGTQLTDPSHPDGRQIFVAENVAAAIEAAKHYYATDWPVEVSKTPATVPFVQPIAEISSRKAVTLHRDNDVLDTWFSSALWPFATLGWPEEQPAPLPLAGGAGGGPAEGLAPLAPTPNPSRTREGDLLNRHYPGDVLISGFDILFFWDARMMMQGMHFMNPGEPVERRVPFKTLYLHGLVRAADGSKMSKSKGNAVDPLGLIDKYGADALRFTLTAMESQGRDIKLDEKRVEGYRNFATKLWNAARFCEANGIGASATLAAPAATLPVNRWIIGEVVGTVTRMEEALAAYRFDDAANAIYHFAWGTFCDWYLELIKPVMSQKPSPLQGRGLGEGKSNSDLSDSPLSPTLSPEGEREIAETRAVAGWVLDQILVMLHPFMPFITEELWSGRGARDGYPLITAKWPEPGATVDAEAKREVEWVINVVSNVRAERTAVHIPPGTRMEAYVAGGDDARNQMIKRNWPTIARLARIDWCDLPSISLGQGNTLQVIVDEVTFALQLDGIIDVAAERTRLSRALESAQKEADSLAKRLANPAFVEKAKPEAVDKARADHAARAAEAERLSAALARLG